MKNWYTILQVSEQADAEVIRAAAKMLSRRYHPDNAETGDAAKFRDVRAAHQVLSDPIKRTAFDQELWGQRNPARAPQSERVHSVRPTPSEIFDPADIGDMIRDHFENAARSAADQFTKAAQNTTSSFFDNIRDSLFQQGERAQRRRRGA